jgi:hypothetical protein
MASSSSHNVVQKYKKHALMVATRPFGEFPNGVYFCEKPKFRKVYAVESFGADYVAIERRGMDPDRIPSDTLISHVFRPKNAQLEVTMKAYCNDFTEGRLVVSATDNHNSIVFVNLVAGSVEDERGRPIDRRSSTLANKTLDNCFVVDQDQLHMRTVSVAEALTPAFKDFYYICQGFMAPEDMTEFEDL